jgi:hypothetical protein
MVRCLPALLVFAFSIVFSAAATAQERQVPFDSAGRVMVIDARMAEAAQLFTHVRGFREARLYQHMDGAYTLEVRYVEDGQELIVRDFLSEGDHRSLQERVESYLVTQPRIGLDQSGRPYLLRRTAGMAYLVWGPSMVGALDIEDGGTATAIALLTGSAGFVVPYLMTRDQPVPMPAARLAFSGSTLGYAHGLALSAAVAGEHISAQGAFATALVFSLGEAYAGYRYGLNPNVTEGTARLMTTGGWFGLGIGSMVGMLTFRDIDNLDQVEDSDRELRTMAALGLAGSVAGVYAGNRFAQGNDYTLGDASVLATAGGLGAYTGITAAVLAEPSFKGGVGLVLVGTSAGLATGYALTKTTNFTASQANYIDLATGAGFLLGAGISQLVSPTDEKTFFAATTIGSAAGFSIMYFSYRSEALNAPSGGTNMRMEIAPIPGTARPGLRLRGTF